MTTNGMTTNGPDTRERWFLQQVPVDNMSIDDAIAQLDQWLDESSPRLVAFLNAHCSNVAAHHEPYRQALRQADLILPDGLGLRIASAIWGHPMVANTNGTDLIPQFCSGLAGRSLFLLGASPGVAAEAGARLQQLNPGLAIAGSHHGYFKAHQTADVIDRINQTAPDVVLVAMGVPRQELFVARHGRHLNTSLIISVGGLFDFLSQRVRRAPAPVRRLGLEWAFRLVQEPRRLWQRYLLGNPQFLIRLLSDRTHHLLRQPGVS